MSGSVSTATIVASSSPESLKTGEASDSVIFDSSKPDVENSQSRTVTWESDTDPLNPLNWTALRKWTNVALIVMQATLSPIASTILAIGADEIAKEFKLDSSYTPALPTALYVLGIGAGPLILAPCSELYGRRLIYVLAFGSFTLLNVGCALSPNIAALSVLRFLSGIAGSVGPSVSAGSVGDMFRVEERGKAQAIASLGPVFGPALGGVIGGFIVYHTTGWAWLLWTVAIAAAFTTTLSLFFLKETYGPYILSRKARRLHAENPEQEFHAEGNVAGKSVGQVLKHSISRPARLLFTSPILAFMAVYQSLIFGILYLHLITILLLFGPRRLYGLFSYEWQSGTTGLAYLGAGTGALIGIIVCAKFMNRSFKAELARHEKKTGSSIPTPEMRIPFLQIGMTLVPFGLIIFAWSAGRTHWAVPLLGALIFGVGMVIGYICIQSYVVDAFNAYSASALAAIIVARCPITCLFCLFGFEMYRNLGYAWGSMLLAFLCIAMMPIPFALKKFGPKLREKQIDF